MKFIQMAFVDGKEKAFTTSYDDGVLQDQRLIDLMNTYEIKGTFNLNADFLGRVERACIDGFDTDVSTVRSEEINKVYSGHEIACHAFTHMKLTSIDKAVVSYQIVEDRKRLEQYTSRIVNGFAYPFGVYDDEVVRVLNNTGIQYARTVENTKQFSIPDDFLKWNPTCHHDEKALMELAEDFCEKVDLFGEPRLFYLWGHAYEFDQKKNWNVVEELFSYLAKYKSDIWFATNGEIVSYVKAYRQLQFSIDGSMAYNPTALDIWIKVDGITKRIPSGGCMCISPGKLCEGGNEE